jgi:hypothetical protein
MSSRQSIILSGLLAGALLLSACSSSHRKPAPRKPMDTHGKSEIFIRGAEDGCATANGDYTKDHDAFNTNLEYHEGWFAGRRYCQV